ncbi:MAG: hypothetical protein KKB50_13730 [Planctomycetes bacterium]|nr:hypothetical protein [Planctomycetota bacterium]
METLAVGQANTGTSPTISKGLDQLKSEDFFRILVSELQQQDPFEPAKTEDMIGQVSQIRSIELSSQLTSTLKQLVQQQQTAGIGDLIGKYVEATVSGPDGSPMAVAGLVTGARFNSDGSALLELDTGVVVSTAQVTRVTTLDVAEIASETSDEGDGDDAAADQANAAAKSGATAKGNAASAKPPWFSLNAVLGL